MGKIVYLENSGNRKPDQRRSYTRSAFNGQSSKGKSRKNSDEEYRKFVAENIALLNSEREALDRQAIGRSRPPSYKTTRVYEFDRVFSDFNLKDGPIKRLLQQHPAHFLPSIAVVHGSQMKNHSKPAFLLGRSIFMCHEDFEHWVTGKSDGLFEDRLLLLLTKYLSIGNTAPA